MFGVIAADKSSEVNPEQNQRIAARNQLQEQTTKSGIMVNNTNTDKNSGCFGDFQAFCSLPRLSSVSSSSSPPTSTNNNPNTSTLWRMTAVVTRRFDPKQSQYSSGSGGRSAAIRLWDATGTNGGICEASTNAKNVFLMIITGQAFEKWFSHLVPKTVVMIGTVSSTSGMIVEPSSSSSSSNSSTSQQQGSPSSAQTKIIVRDPSDICTIGFSDNVVPCGMLNGVRTNDANNSTCETFVNKLKAKACLKHVVQANKIHSQHMSGKTRISEAEVVNSAPTAKGLFAIKQEQQQIQQKQQEAQHKWQLKQQRQQQDGNNNNKNNNLISVVHRVRGTGAPVSQNEASRIMNPNSISDSNLSNFHSNNPYLQGLMTTATTGSSFIPSVEMSKKVVAHTFTNPLAAVFGDTSSTLPNPMMNNNNNNASSPTAGGGNNNNTRNNNSSSSPNNSDKITLPSSISSSRSERKDNLRVVGNMNKLVQNAMISTSKNNTNDASSSSSTSTSIPHPASTSIVARTLQAAANESRRRQREEEESELQKAKQKEQADQIAKHKQQQMMRDKQNQKLVFAHATNATTTATMNNNNGNNNITSVPKQKPVFAPLNNRAETQQTARNFLTSSSSAANNSNNNNGKATTALRPSLLNPKHQPGASNITNTNKPTVGSTFAASLGLSSNFVNLSKSMTSKNDDLANQARKEEVNQKLNKIEQQAIIFDALDNVTESQTKAFHCPLCQRTTLQKQKTCVDKQHPISVVNTVKRYYRCGKCKNGRLPGVGDSVPVNIPCTRCGASQWERTTAAGGPGAQEVKNETVTVVDSTSSK